MRGRLEHISFSLGRKSRPHTQNAKYLPNKTIKVDLNRIPRSETTVCFIFSSTTKNILNKEQNGQLALLALYQSSTVYLKLFKWRICKAPSGGTFLSGFALLTFCLPILTSPFFPARINPLLDPLSSCSYTAP